MNDAIIIEQFILNIPNGEEISVQVPLFQSFYAMFTFMSLIISLLENDATFLFLMFTLSLFNVHNIDPAKGDSTTTIRKK